MFTKFNFALDEYDYNYDDEDYDDYDEGDDPYPWTEPRFISRIAEYLGSEPEEGWGEAWLAPH